MRLPKYVLPVTVAAAAVTASLAMAPQAEAAGSKITIEADFTANRTSHPDGHHTANNFTDPETGYSADWATDYGIAAGTPITPRLNGPANTTMKVSKVAASCSGGGGGTGVQVRVNEGSEVIGFVSYLHLSDVGVEVGDTVTSDTVLGKIGSGYTVDDNCWTGPHLHLEGLNRADYSCWVAPSSVQPGSVLGRIGGSDVTSAGSACP